MDAEGLKAINAACMQTLDRNQVQQKPGKKSASYVSGYYVKMRLSEIFTPLGWSSSASAEFVTHYEAPNKYGEQQHHVTYRATCEIQAGGAVRRDVGGATSIDKDLGTAHENAYKAAATDALKRAAALFGPSLGLALYDKEQEHVGDPGADPIASKKVADAVCAAYAASKTRSAMEGARKLRIEGWERLTEADRDRVLEAGKAAAARVKAAAGPADEEE